MNTHTNIFLFVSACLCSGVSNVNKQVEGEVNLKLSINILFHLFHCTGNECSCEEMLNFPRRKLQQNIYKHTQGKPWFIAFSP